jgi:hypothetical protein
VPKTSSWRLHAANSYSRMRPPIRSDLRNRLASGGDASWGFGRIATGCLVKGSVPPMAVVMIDVLHQDSFELTSVEDQRPVQTRSADGPDETLRKRVCPGAIERMS